LELTYNASEHAAALPGRVFTKSSATLASEMVEQLARYHAAFWNGNNAPDALRGLPSSLEFQTRLNQRIALARQFQRGLERSQYVIPRQLWTRRHELWPALLRSMHQNAQGPQTR
jgi:hypothetical protein